MPKLKPETQSARRDRILDAAELCFARGGFHRTTMHDICREAAISPGGLYVHFASKEALIAGLCERDRNEFAVKLEAVKTVPDFLSALNRIAENYFHEQPAHKRLMAVEIAVEAMRNPRIDDICRPVDQFVFNSFLGLFQRLKDEGRIAPKLDIPTLTEVFKVVSEGLFWRRAVEPNFDARAVLPGLTILLQALLEPVPAERIPTSARDAPDTAPTRRRGGKRVETKSKQEIGQ